MIYPRDRVKTTIKWGCFRNKRGYLIEWRGDRPYVQFDDYVSGVLLFAGEVELDEPATAGAEP